MATEDVVGEFLQEIEQMEAEAKENAVETVVEGVRRLGQHRADSPAVVAAREAVAVETVEQEPETTEREPEEGRSSKVTVYLGDGVLKDVQALQETWGASLSETVKWLTMRALDGLKEGWATPPDMEPRAVLWEDRR